MRKSSIRTVLVTFMVGVAILVSGTAIACTVVRYQVGEDYLVARNHDWLFGEGLVIIEPRGLNRTALTPIRPAKWTSKFGSVSLTQFGRGIPFAGMNEAGLTVDLLQLKSAEFPSATAHDRDTVNVIQWVQYQLDTASSVDEVIASLDSVLPLPLIPNIERVHYFVTDASGGVAIVEFMNGKPVVRRGPEATHCALANTDIESEQKAYSGSPTSRYGQAVCSIQDVQQSPDLDTASTQAFCVLDDVSQDSLTRWSLLYQPKHRRLTFQTEASSSQRWLDLDDFDFASGSPSLSIDVLTDKTGNLRSHFQPITPEDNAAIVNHSFDQYLPPGLGRVAVKQLVLNHAASLRQGEPAGGNH
ncbi:hypothetical protein Pla22_43640 [Rubripirellula amarantea]|uniref:Choloylglycine hydrolase/NAAA C-terminal domain-containing protein n=1 Tax=Rubripirellula amarantea TaxID=2527999 RepID=A0A5C5WHA3_9BACT|nr:linear amide C-N hydrolase [Rubripirellula amarantea]TWT49172.1 hypothetical protein Pla22_43640 [Rubripirellula amarantea]